MSRPTRLLPILLVVLVAACGGDGGDDPDGGPDAPGPGGRYDSPDDFDHASCPPGSLAGREPQGIYHVQVDFEGFVQTLAARFDVLAPGSFGGALAGRDVTSATATADDLFWYRRLDDQNSRSMLLCGVDADGLLIGYYAFCSDSDCFLGRATGSKVDRLPEPAAENLTLLGEHANPSWGTGISVNVRVVDKYAYLARYQDGLRIIDISNPAAPVDVGHAPVESPESAEIYNDVKVVRTATEVYAIVGSNVSGAVVWRVTNPGTPTIVTHLGTLSGTEPPNVHTLFIEGDRLYLANIDLGLEIYDLSNPAQPVRLGQVRTPAGPDAFLHDLSVRGDRAYLNFWGAGMQIVDVSNPAQPRVLGTFADYGETTSHSNWVTTVGPRSIAAHGDEQWGSHLRLVDVTEGSPTFLDQLGEWETRPAVSAHNIMAFGSTVYLAYYQDGVRLVDISNPAAPRQVAHYNTWPGYDRAYGASFFEGAVGIDVDLVRRRVYVADSHRGLLILSDTRPAPAAR